MGLTLKEVFLILIGLGYVVNHRSREIHRLEEKTSNCKLEFLAKHNREYVGRRRAMKLIKECGYNGCRWCWPVQDRG